MEIITDIYYSIREFIRNIVKTARLLPVIWRWKEWDWEYTEDLILKALQLHRDHFKSDSATLVNAPIQAQKMDLAIRLLKKVNNEEYMLEYVEKLETRWGKGILEGNLTGYSLSFNYETHPLADKIEKELDVEMKKSIDKHRRAQLLVWKIIAHHSSYWWD